MKLTVEKLSAKYNIEQDFIFKDIDFEVHSGEFILLTGLSGSGKSTLLNCLNGILCDEDNKGLIKGKILLDDIELSTLNANDRSMYIASVLQNADEQIIFEKVEDELAFPLENMALEPTEIKNRIEKYSAMMNLSLDSRTSKLSGGQKQSLITASSFGMERKILLFDEPLANLDNKAAVKLLDTLKEFCTKKGYIVLFSEHRIDLVLEYTDKVFYMNDSKLKSISDKKRFKSYLDNRVNKITESLVSSNTNTNLSTKQKVIFDIENLHFNVANKDILKGINYKFFQGGKYVINGENGCGKSTFIKLLTGIYKPSKGQIISTFSKKERFKKISLVMQNPNYQLFMPSVEGELKLQAKNDDFLTYLIDIFRLKDILNTHPHSLSEGQKRRVGVASILSMMPEVLILDEPSVGQDYKNMSNMIDAIQELCKLQETTVISISHDLRCMNNLGDIFLELKDGIISSSKAI